MSAYTAGIRRPGRGTRRTILRRIAVLTLIGAGLGACANPEPMGPSRSILSVQAVVDRLPQAFDGVAGVVTIIDDNFLSGTDADEVLEALGVTRADAIVVVV